MIFLFLFKNSETSKGFKEDFDNDPVGFGVMIIVSMFTLSFMEIFAGFIIFGIIPVLINMALIVIALLVSVYMEFRSEK